MNLKKIGQKENIFISINTAIEDKWFTDINLVINNYTFPTEEKENLTFLCVDFKSLIMGLQNNSLKRYDDNYFWSISDNEIIRLWNKFFNIKTIEEMEDEEVILFDEKFTNSRLPFDSRFLNIWTFVAQLNDTTWNWKVWKTINPSEVLNFKVSDAKLLSFLEETTRYLEDEVLLD